MYVHLYTRVQIPEESGENVCVAEEGSKVNVARGMGMLNYAGHLEETYLQGKLFRSCKEIRWNDYRRGFPAATPEFYIPRRTEGVI